MRSCQALHASILYKCMYRYRVMMWSQTSIPHFLTTSCLRIWLLDLQLSLSKFVTEVHPTAICIHRIFLVFWLEGHLHHAINFLSFIKEQIKFDPFLCNWWVLWFMSTQDNPDLWVWRGSNSHRNPSLQKPPNVDALCHLPFSSKIAQTSLTMLDNLRLKLKFPSDIISNREACTSWAMRLMQI